MSKKDLLLPLVAVIVVSISACSPSEAGDTTEATGDTSAEAMTSTTSTGEDDIVIAVSWSNLEEPHLTDFDKPAIEEAVASAGGTYIEADAGSSPEQQLADVDDLLAAGADVLLILAQDPEAILPAVHTALDQGVHVIAYDRLIDVPGVLYVTFDEVGVGRAMTETLLPIVPEGSYAIVQGDEPNAPDIRIGIAEAILEPVTAGNVMVVCEEHTDSLDPVDALTSMEQCLSRSDNEIDAVLAGSDAVATGVIGALADHDLAGRVPVSGQGGDPAALNRVALGLQSVSVWKDARRLGRAAGEAALQLAQGVDLRDVGGGADFESPAGNSMTVILLGPTPVTQDNLDVVVDAGWISHDDLCQNVGAGTVDVCG